MLLRSVLLLAATAFAAPAFAADAPTAEVPAPMMGGDAAQMIDQLKDDIAARLDAIKQALPAADAPAGTAVLTDGLSSQEMADIIRDAGYKADVKMDSNNEPYIDSRASGLNFWVYLYRCGEGEDPKCLRIQFQSSFSTNKEQQDKANQWNIDKVVGRAYNIKDSTYFDYVIDGDGGLTTDNLVRNVELWDTLMGEFARYIGW